jgi:hypothetical protein
MTAMAVAASSAAPAMMNPMAVVFRAHSSFFTGKLTQGDGLALHESF